MVSGDILSIKITNPNLGSKTCYPVASTDGTINMGGLKSDDDKSKIDGGGRIIDKRNRQRWGGKVTVSWDMNDSTGDELSFFTAIQQDLSANQFTISHINGSVYSGVGVLVGDNEGGTQDAQIELNMQGSGILSKIA